MKLLQILKKFMTPRIRPKQKYELLSACEIIALYERTDKDTRDQLRYRSLRAFKARRRRIVSEKERRRLQRISPFARKEKSLSKSTVRASKMLQIGRGGALISAKPKQGRVIVLEQALIWSQGRSFCVGC